MKAVFISNILVLVTISCLIEARPRNSLKENTSKKVKYVGCVLPFQFVNPYYHPLTARSCANLLSSEIPRISRDEYGVGCDCISGFAMNFQGDCIDESQCTIFEAYGRYIYEGKIIVPSSEEHKKVLQEHHEETDQENQIENIQDKTDSQKPTHVIQNFFKENTNDQNKADNIGTGEQKLNSNGNSEQGNDIEEGDCCEDGDDGCEIEYLECVCSDEPQNVNKTEQQTSTLLPTENTSINKPTTLLNSSQPSVESSNTVKNDQAAVLEKTNQSQKKTQSPSGLNVI